MAVQRKYIFGVGYRLGVIERFEIALWSACMRLPTWRDQPASQAAPRGGSKQAGAGINTGDKRSASLPESKDLTATSSYGDREDDTPPLEPGMAETVQTIDEEEGELRDALFGERPAEVKVYRFIIIARALG